MKLAANLSLLFGELPLVERIGAAAAAGFGAWARAAAGANARSAAARAAAVRPDRTRVAGDVIEEDLLFAADRPPLEPLIIGVRGPGSSRHG